MEQSKSTNLGLSASQTAATSNKYARPYVDAETVKNNRLIMAMVGCNNGQRNLHSPKPYEALPRWLKRRIKRMRRTNKQQQWGTLDPTTGQKAFYMDKSLLPRGPQAKGAKA